MQISDWVSDRLRAVLDRAHLALALALVAVSQPGDAVASGLRTHLYIADELIADIRPDCRVTIRGAEFHVPLDTCDGIRAHPQSFRAGVIGPDGFPDFITGQVTTHPGIEDDWQTADWIARLNDRTSTSAEIAFVAGYAVHAASDIFAHSYVNTYAGDIFDLKDERNVERRHFVLEKYIDYALPETPTASGLTAPAAFLSRELIFDPDAARLAGKSGAAPHIAAMYGTRVAVDTLDRQLRGVEDLAGNLVARALAEKIKVGAQLASGEQSLQAALIVLGANQKQLELKKAALDAQEKLFNAAVDAVERNKEAILQSELRAKAAREAILASRAAMEAAQALVARTEQDLIALEAEIARTPSRVTKQVCNEVGGACRRCGWLCSPICEPTKLVCRAVDVANDVYDRLVAVRADLLYRISRAKNDAAREAIAIQTNTALEAAELAKAAEERLLTAGLEASRDAARVPFEAARLQYELELQATNTADENVRRLREEVAKIRQRLIDTESIEAAMNDAFDRLRPLSLFTTNWLKGIDRGGEAYIGAAQESAIAMVDGGNVLSPYTEWLKCHFSAFAGVPYQIPSTVCAAERFIDHVDGEISKIVERVLPEPFASLYRAVNDIKARVRDDVRTATARAAIELAKLAAPDAATADFMDLLANPANATRGKLTEVFATRADAAGKSLLVFPDVASMIDRDIGMKDGKLDPDAFRALAYARTLSRLALLDRDGLRSVVKRFGGDVGELAMSDSPARYTLIVDMARSIDGNHQWQRFGLPYPRDGTPPVPSDPEQRRFGYGPSDGRKGLSLFGSESLRRDVFSYLFPASFLGQVGEHPAMQFPTYAFPTCGSNAFPLAARADGSPADQDDRCIVQPDGGPLRPSTWAVIKRKWFGFWEELLGARARPVWNRSRFAN